MDDIKRPNLARRPALPPARYRAAPAYGRRSAITGPVVSSGLPTPARPAMTVRPAPAPLPVSNGVDRSGCASYSLHPFAAPSLIGAGRQVRQLLPSRRKHPVLARAGWGLMAALMFGTVLIESFHFRQQTVDYHLSSQADTLVGEKQPLFADKLKLDAKHGVYMYNDGYKPALTDDTAGDGTAGQVSGPKFSASFAKDPSKGATVTDPVSQTSVSFKPAFASDEPVQDGNRLVYPLTGRDAQKVYTLGASGMKEDIILNHPQGETADFTYNLQLSSGTEARLESDGSLAVYGVSSSLLGNVSTGSDADAKLLEKARQNGAKNNLLFTFPAPFVKETGKAHSSARAWFELKGKQLTLHAAGLAAAAYPLSIDPSVYLESAAKLMRGNNETNIDFDTQYDLFKKSKTTGARINAWSSTGAMATGMYDQGTAAAGGYIYAVGGQVTSANRRVLTPTSDSSFVVPAGVSTITVKMWGGGGGAGAGNGGTGAGGSGGGGGFASADLTVTPAETLSVVVGSGGAAGGTSSSAGNGGGFSAIKRGSTYLLQSGGGGGGGGAWGTTNGGAGGAGGGSSGVAGTTVTGGGGGAGTTTAGSAGAAGTGGVAGSVGAANAGGNGGGSLTSCNTSVANQTADGNGFGGGGQGGGVSGCVGGGGGGGGRFGGGGGGSTSSGSNRGGGGGGGGSSLASGAGQVQTAGTGSTPGQNADTDRNGAAGGGTGGTSAATAATGQDGLMVITYSGGSTTNVSQTLYWAHFNNSTKAVESPNPGNGTCSGWCTSSAYDLPAARKGFSLVSYNGYLYAIGGTDGTTRASTVYVAKLGANGEPQLWHPTGGTPVYWYTDSGLNGGTARSYLSAVAYNNRLYVLGGQTNASTGGVTTVEYANINPNGTLSSWTAASGSKLLPYVLHSFSVQTYNGVLYIIGGNSNGTLKNTVYYSKLNSDGSLNDWVQTNSFTTGRTTLGGSYTAVWGAYMYLGGGCTNVTLVSGSTYCNGGTASDVQLASINADGSLASWNSINGLANVMFGQSMLSWEGGLYRLGGCMSQNTSTGACLGTLSNVDYGVINKDGDVSTVSNSSPSGTTPCNGANPVNCDLPPPGDGAGQGGQMSTMVVVDNGYIYNIGGCIDLSAGSCAAGTFMSGNISYAALNNLGQLSAPSACSGTSYGLWCVDNTNKINNTGNGATDGLGAGVATVFNDTIYVIGGTNGTANGWTSNVYSVALNRNGSLSGAWTVTATGTSGLPTNYPTVSAAGAGSNFTTQGGANGIGYGYMFTRANPAGAGTTPGYLYYMGGCNSTSAGIGCTTYSNGVYRCNIGATGGISGCATTNQMQIDADDQNTGNQGLGLMAGAVYANRLYLVGGACTAPTGAAATDPCGSSYSGNRQDTIYAKIDNNNNIVDNVSGLSTGSWDFTSGKMSPVRRRAVSFGYNGYIYSLAGYSGSASLQDLLFAQIDVTTGDMGNFSSSGVVVTPRWDLRAVVGNGYVYAIGGCGAGAAPTCTAMQPQIQTFQLYNNDSGAVASYTPSANTFSANTDRWGASSTVLNGYLYVAGGCTSATDCTAAISSVQYAAISTVDGSIGTWQAATAGLPSGAVGRAWGQLVTAGGYLYYLGGQESTAANRQSTVYYAQPGSGDISSWGTATKAIGDTGSGGQARTSFSAAVWDNRIYVLGGLNGAGTVTNTVYVSPKLANGGDITANWTSSTAFTTARSGLAATAYANNLYIFGGFDGTNYLNDSQFAPLGYKAGTISQSGNTVTGVGTTWTSAHVGYDMQFSDGSTTTITAVNSATSLTVSDSKTVPAGTKYTIKDGSVGSWAFSTPLTGRVSQASAFAANGYVYLIGGRSAASSCTPTTTVAPISANTSIAAGNDPTGLGQWYDTNTVYAGGRYGAAVAYAAGKTYILGGGCTSPIGPNYTTGTIQQTGTAVTGSGGTVWTDNLIGGTVTYSDTTTATITGVNSNTSLTVNVSKTVAAGSAYSINVPRNTVGVLNSEPQVAAYSRMIDTDSDVFPTKWLMNGVDNSIGAKWQLRYRSMHDLDSLVAPNEDCGDTPTMPTMTTWGQETNYGDVTLGTPGVYTPKNGSGANINCARYFYFYVSIDASKTFGYPEDVSRGPTISDLSLYFTADPSKRLMHGRTFLGGEQQPLDTPLP